MRPPGAPPRAPRAGFQAHPSDHRFFAAMSIVAAAVVLSGFARTYGPKLASGGAGLPAIVHVHAALFTSWLLLFVVQTTLVLRGRTDLHRRLGISVLAVAPLMVAVGAVTAVVVARLGHRGIPGVEFPDPAGFLLLNLASITVFTVLVAAAWRLRRNPQAHKRLMLMATVGGLMPPGISRLPWLAGRPGAIAAVVVAFLLAPAVYDLVTRRRVHAAYAWSILFTLVSVPPPVVTALSATPLWRGIAAWLL